MIIVGYVTLDPKGDRPYFSSRPPPKELDRRGGEVRVFEFKLLVDVPDAVPLEELPGLTLSKEV
jgi:hypothetical protein